MKIAMLSGAYVNAGDFLIEKRAKELTERFIKNADIEIFKRNKRYDDEIDILNNFEGIIFAGGPLYQTGLYPKAMPFVSDLEKITVPVMTLGCGWKGKDDKDRTLLGDYYFSAEMMRFLNFVEKKGVPLGCRDWYTVERLKKSGIANLIMTGCPAWYDLENIDNLNTIDYEAKWKRGIHNICISDSAFAVNRKNLRGLIVFLRRKFPDAEITLVFHRGISKYLKDFGKMEFLEHYHISSMDISGSCEGFKIYDTCDLHIGFRVHAHIYNLSRGNVSVLLNEDMRGKGVNDALGLKNLFLRHDILKRSAGDKYLVDKLDAYLTYIEQTHYMQYRMGGARMKYYFGNMKRHLEIYGESLQK